MSITLKWEGMGFEHCMGLSEREREYWNVERIRKEGISLTTGSGCLYVWSVGLCKGVC